MQILYQHVGEDRHEICVPDASERVVDRLRWGNASHLFTPAFWAARARAHELFGTYGNCQTGKSLAEEYGHCILGGYGMPAEVGWAACERLCQAGVFEEVPGQSEIEALLLQPLQIGDRRVRYRFPKRKAAQIAAGLPYVLSLSEDSLSDLELRAALLKLPGLGPKTSSWIVRNYRASDDVAIIDIHIARAGWAAGVFSKVQNPARDYFEMERLFLRFSRALQVRPSVLDHLIWNEMRQIGWLLDK